MIFASFRDFQLERDRPTDRPTDQPTDRASYRGAMAHLKTQSDVIPVLNPLSDSGALLKSIRSFNIN